MLQEAKRLIHCKIDVEDGEIGHVSDLLFDDEQWMIRYVVVDTARIFGRKVLIAPDAIVGEPDLAAKTVSVALTKEKLKNCPDAASHQPVSRRREEEVRAYFGWPYYWTGNPMLGAGGYVSPYLAEQVAIQGADETEEAHLHSVREIVGYTIDAKDDEIGHVDDFIVDEDWRIVYLVVATGAWLSPKRVLIAVPWIKGASWESEEVTVDLTKAEIESSPEYEGLNNLDRAYEERLHKHYGRSGYWPEDA